MSDEQLPQFPEGVHILARLCDHKDCVARARWSLGFRVWGQGFSKEDNPDAFATFLTPVRICDAHKADPGSIAEWFPALMRAQITTVFVMQGKAVPDFDSAEFYFEVIEEASRDN